MIFLSLLQLIHFVLFCRLDAFNTRRRLLHHDCHTEHLSWGILRGARQALVSHPHGLDHSQRHQLLHHIEASGARVMGYLPENTWALVGSPESLSVAVNHSLVMWSGYHEPAHKIAPEWQELIGQIEAAMPSGGSLTKDFRSSSASIGGINATVEAQVLAASVLAELPVQVRRLSGQWPQIGIRVTFPTAHTPRPLPSYHPDAAAHSLRIRRVLREQESYTAGIAAVSDWTPILQSTFGNAVEVVNGGPNSVVVFAPPAQVHDVVEWLAERPSVRWVSPLPRIFLKNKQASVITQASRPAPTGRGNGNNNLDPSLHPIWAAGIQGQNQVIGQGDSGLNYNHCFFVDPNVDWASSVSVVGRARTFQSETHRKIRLYRAFADFTDANGHGTHTAGTLAGIPYGSTIEDDGGVDIGMAPAAKLAFIDLSSASDGDAILTPYDLINDYFPYTTSVGAEVHSDSWGSTSITYDNEAAQVDSYCWKHPTFLPVFPAGNDGDKRSQAGATSGETTVNSPATSKNCLAAGATQTSAEVAVKGDFAGKVWAAKAALGPNFALNFRVLQSDFSNSFSTLGNQVFKLVAAQPLSACSALTNGADLAGAIALIERGNCTFVDKAQAAQIAGAAGALVFDDQAAAYFVATGGNSGGSSNNLIPTATMPRRLGQNLLAVLSTGRSIDISFANAAEPDFGFENLASFSSQGPVGRDKRIKPDIVAPGTITSASASSPDNCGVATYGGTSMATPVVAGSAILVRQYFMEGFYPSGASNSQDGFEPTSALVKAVLISGAATLSGYEADTGLPIDPTPSFRQGFGRVFLGNSLFIQNNPYSPKNLALLDNVPINTGDVHQYCITAGGGPLTVTLVWTDYPGEPSAAVSLVNDLDLVVRAEGLNGQPLLGNGGGVENSSEADKANNIEQVTLPAVPAGRVSVEVRGSSIQAFSGSQPYAIVINGDFAGVVTAPTASGSAGAECAVVVATITSGPTGVTNAKKVSFELGTTSGGSTGVSYECKLADGSGGVGAPGTADWSSCTSPATYDNLPDGTYTFSVRASGEKIDSSVVFTKDTAPPVVSLQSDVPATTSAATAKMTFAGNDMTPVSYTCRVSVQGASSQQGDLVAGTAVAVPVQQGVFYNCTSPQTLAWLLPGTWNFAVEATDSAGNKAQAVTTSWTVNEGSTTSRSVRVTAGPILKIPKREVEFSLAVLEPDTGGATISSAASTTPTECSLVGVGSAGIGGTVPSEWSSCTSSVSYGQPSDGDYLFAARVVGDASLPQLGVGLPSTWAVSTFSVDSTPPTVNLTAGPSGGRAVSDTTVTFEFSLSEEGSTATCKLDAKDVPSDSIPFTPCASPVQLTNLTGGHYNFSVTPSDAVGNNGSPFITEFVVDGTPPNISANASVTPDNTAVKITFTASDGAAGAGIKNVTCRVRPAVLAASVSNQIDTNDPRFNYQPCTSPFIFTGVVEGHWIAGVIAYDNADQASKPSEIDVWVDTVAPVTAISNAPKSGVITPGGRIVFSLSDTTEKQAPGAGSPVQWQALLKSVSEEEFKSYSRSSDTQQGTAAAAAPSVIRMEAMTAPSTTDTTIPTTTTRTTSDNDSVELGRDNLNKWTNCTSDCTFNGLGSGAYLFQARGVDASGNVGEATTPPVAFKMEGVSSGLPTWALIAIIVGSVVVGIALLAILWSCCCKSRRNMNSGNSGGSGLPNGVIASNGNGYPMTGNGYSNGYANGTGTTSNGWSSYGSAPPPLYMNGSGGTTANGYSNNINGYANGTTGYNYSSNVNGRTTSPLGTAASNGHIQIPEDPIEAQELALALAASNAQQQRQQQQQASAVTYPTFGSAVVPTPRNEDAELRAALEASLAEERSRTSAAAISSNDDDLHAAIQASLEEQRRQQEQLYTASGWQQPPSSAPPAPSPHNPFAEWAPRS
jgi:Subtilase family/PA domain